MNNPVIIPTNFKVPKNFRHEWLLFYENECISIISGVPGKKQIEQHFRDPSKCEDFGRLRSQSLDWIAESVSHLRYLLE